MAGSEITSEANGTRTRPPATRLLLLVVGGALAVYIATWFPSLLFFAFFQRQLLAEGEDPAKRSMLWGVPAEEAAQPAPDWQVLAIEGVNFRGPPGAVRSSKLDGELISVDLEAGKFKLQSYPKGFISSLFEERLENLGMVVGQLSDPETLRDVVRETPENFQFGWSGRERKIYAARLLTKMLLLESKVIEKARLAWRQEPPAAALLAEHESGEARLIVADHEGVLVILLPGDVPPEWRSPANWMR